MLLAAAAGFGYLYFHDPADIDFFLLPECPFFMVTGLYCPGCGGTRAAYAFLHGDFITGFRNNIILVPALLVAGICFIHPKAALNPLLTRAILIVMIAYWILRNIPCRPFCWLAPL
ncbi:MAG: DUF2752 domain-containing protein [Victivallaceae bacterium]